MQYLPIQNKIIDFFENLRATEGNFIYLEKYNDSRLKNNSMVMENSVYSNSSTTESNDLVNKVEIDDWKLSRSLNEFRDIIKNCQKCYFGKTRQNLVFGEGNPNAEIMVIGEGPGADEDAKGEPFVGRAGQLLTKILGAINLKREDVFIANVVKCRPPGNKTPTETEFSDCLPYLLKQIEIINPKFILTLGAVPLLALFGKEYQISKHRGKILDYKGIKVIPTYHPAYLLRNPSAKIYVWEDVQILEKMYKEIKFKEKE